MALSVLLIGLGTAAVWSRGERGAERSAGDAAGALRHASVRAPAVQRGPRIEEPPRTPSMLAPVTAMAARFGPLPPEQSLAGAALRGDLNSLHQALALGLPIDAQDETGRTALAWATLAGQPQSAALLIERGASVRRADRDGVTPLMLAARDGSRELAGLLMSHGAPPTDVDHQGRTALMFAAAADQPQLVKVLIEGGAALEERCARGMSALHHAAAHHAGVDALQCLLDIGAAIEARDSKGATALALAAHAGHVEVLRVLLDRGAQINSRDHDDLSALDYVVMPREDGAGGELRARLLRALQLLLDRGIDRRLGQNPRTTAILFRPELDALALREGRPPLPGYRSTGATDRPIAAIRLFDRVPTQNSRRVPQYLYPEAVLKFGGWGRVPNIVRRVELQGLSLMHGQRVGLSGDSAGEQAWEVDDVLLVELLVPDGRRRSRFIGNAEEVVIGDRVVPRMGERAQRFSSRAIDLTEFLSATADRTQISLLDYGGWTGASSVFLWVEGPRAAQTLGRLRLVDFRAQ